MKKELRGYHLMEFDWYVAALASSAKESPVIFVFALVILTGALGGLAAATRGMLISWASIIVGVLTVAEFIFTSLRADNYLKGFEAISLGVFLLLIVCVVAAVISFLSARAICDGLANVRHARARR